MLKIPKKFNPGLSIAFESNFSEFGINFPNLHRLSEIFISTFKLEDLSAIDCYGIDRLIMSREVFEVELKIYQGYYDDIDVEDIYFQHNTLKSIVDQIDEYLSLSEEEKINWLLLQEYQILPVAVDTDWQLETISLEQIVLPSDYHFSPPIKYSAKRLEAYQNRYEINQTPKGYPFKKPSTAVGFFVVLNRKLVLQ